jgi:hypothetical protein
MRRYVLCIVGLPFLIPALSCPLGHQKLRPNRVYSGIVVEVDTHSPIEGVTVLVTSFQGTSVKSHVKWCGTDQTDSDGFFAIASPGMKHVEIRVLHPRYHPNGIPASKRPTHIELQPRKTSTSAVVYSLDTSRSSSVGQEANTDRAPKGALYSIPGDKAWGWSFAAQGITDDLTKADIVGIWEHRGSKEPRLVSVNALGDGGLVCVDEEYASNMRPGYRDFAFENAVDAPAT